MGYIIAAILLVATALFWLSAFAWRVFKNPTPVRYDDHYVSRLIHGLVIVSILAIVLPAASFQLGKDIQRHYDAAYFAQRFSNPGLKAWTRTAAAPRAVPVLKILPAVESIDLTHYWAGGMQGQIGECAGWSSAKAYTYAYRLKHLATHPGIKFSPQWFYDFYSDKFSGGQDLGSIQTEDLKVVWGPGAVQYKLYPSAVPVTYPFPTSPTLLANAALHSSPIDVRTLYMGNPSDVVYDEIKLAISTGQVAMVALNVTPSFDAATQNGGRIWYQGNESNRGGHAVNAIEVDDTMVFPDGSVGGVLLDNQWSSLWGIGDKAWVSRKWIAQNMWAVMVIAGGVNAHA